MGDLFLGEGCSCSIKKLKSEIFNDKKVGNFEKRELGQFSGLRELGEKERVVFVRMVVGRPMHTLHHKLLELFDGTWLYGRTYNGPRPLPEKISQTI